jgi:hypothetical protein
VIREPEGREHMAGKMPRRATDIVEDAVAWLVGSAALMLIVARSAQRGHNPWMSGRWPLAVLERPTQTAEDLRSGPARPVSTRWRRP